MRRRAAWAVVVIAVIAGFVLTSGTPRPKPNPPGTFSFAVLGDAPYYFWEEWRYRFVLRSIDEHDLGFIIHVGDIWWRPCVDARYQKTKQEFDDRKHPVIYTPGDNEWFDCWEPGSGAFAPQERLKRLREIFYRESPSLHGVRQREFVENVRWQYQGIELATLHLIGSRNGMKPFPQRTPADDEAARRRTDAAIAWMRETFAEARRTGARAVVFGFHTSLLLELPLGHEERRPYEPFIAALEEEVERFGGPVLIVQGDDHEYIVDSTLVNRRTGRRLENFTRMQVPGSPDVGWVRVIVTPGAKPAFAFENHVVPRWKYW